MSRPHGKYARVSATNPENFAQCDRCGFWRNGSDLVWQDGWAGQQLYNLQILVCRDRCYDVPNEQFRTIILPPDPPPVLNARVPDFAYEEQTPRIIQFAQGAAFNYQTPWGSGPALIRATQFAGSDDSGQARVLQYLTSS